MIKHLKTLQNTLLPTRCLFCHRQTELARPICEDCEIDLPWIIDCCQQCAMPYSKGWEYPKLCNVCLYSPPPWARLITSCRYQWPVKSLMIRFKYQGDFVAGRALAYLLAQNLAHEYANRVWPETLIPVPLHWCRRLYRGFNQAQWLAKAVLRELNTQFSPSELPVLNTHLCRRTRYTPSQQGLSKDQRENNLNKAFIIKSKSLEGHSFALIDDVVTTGSTAAAISHELMRVGADEIALWAPTRVLPKQ